MLILTISSDEKTLSQHRRRKEDPEEGGGLVHMMRNLEAERLTLAAMSLGIADRCVDIMIQYVDRKTTWFRFIARLRMVDLRKQAPKFDTFGRGLATRSKECTLNFCRIEQTRHATQTVGEECLYLEIAEPHEVNKSITSLKISKR